MPQKIFIITGTTAVGKTEFALDFAEQVNAEIVSCDASLFYRGMDIGTAKPSLAEQKRVPHHMLDICQVDQPYSIVSYVADVRTIIAAIFERGRSVLATGGSGFYLKSFLYPVTDRVDVSENIRTQVAQYFSNEGLIGLLGRLDACNPDGLGTLDRCNPRRVQRALERCMASGKTLAELQAEFEAQPAPYAECEKELILLERSVEDLRSRCALRVDAMLAAGLIEEVAQLKRQGIERNPSAAAAIGYRETLAYLRGELDLTQLRQQITVHTQQLAKKQRTWFRTQIPEPDQRKFLSEST
tara:strand:+ start:463 stop:1359 length:897 start_codon:yes stop_codon:yes gene_type:complete